jgi:Tfp pilus assembly protein FimV
VQDDINSLSRPPKSVERPKRRRLSAAYKLRILSEYDTLDRAGKGELLRREGLYTSLISEWRKQRDKGAREALASKVGRPPQDPVQRENNRLRDRVKRLETELERARSVIEVQAKSSALLQEAAELEKRNEVIQKAIIELTPVIGTRAACAALGRSRQWHYRSRREENSGLSDN